MGRRCRAWTDQASKSRRTTAFSLQVRSHFRSPTSILRHQSLILRRQSPTFLCLFPNIGCLLRIVGCVSPTLSSLSLARWVILYSRLSRTPGGCFSVGGLYIFVAFCFRPSIDLRLSSDRLPHGRRYAELKQGLSGFREPGGRLSSTAFSRGEL